eukprot:jgi/Chlat1/5467/Chrsp36S00420
MAGNGTTGPTTAVTNGNPAIGANTMSTMSTSTMTSTSTPSTTIGSGFTNLQQSITSALPDVESRLRGLVAQWRVRGLGRTSLSERATRRLLSSTSQKLKGDRRHRQLTYWLAKLALWFEANVVFVRCLWLCTSVASFVLYVVGTYGQYRQARYRFTARWWGDIISGGLLLPCFSLEVLKSHSKGSFRSYFFSLQGLIDLANALMLVPPLVAVAGSGVLDTLATTRRFNAWMDAVRAIRLERPLAFCVRAYKMVPNATIRSRSKRHRFKKLGFMMLCMNSPEPSSSHFYYHNAVYYCVVTMATVGYGDISPKGVVGQIVVCFLIVAGIALFSALLSELVRCVWVGELKANKMASFLEEFYHPDHGPHGIISILLGEQPPPDELELLLAEKRFMKKVKYLQGSASVERDLHRARVQDADAVFILNDEHPQGGLTALKKRDVSALLRLIAVKQFSPEVPVVMQLNTASYLHLALRADNIICVQEFKLVLLASNTAAPGVIPLIYNLLASQASYSVPSDSMEAAAPWWIEYLKGATQEVYRWQLPPCLYGLNLQSVIAATYRAAGVVTFAIETGNSEYGSVEPGDVAYVIAQDVAELQTIMANLPMGLLEDFHNDETKVHEEFRQAMQASNAVWQLPEEKILERQQTLKQQDSPELKNHVVVFGTPSNLLAFLRPLQATSSEQPARVVLILDSTIHPDADSVVESFPEVRFVAGSPLNIEDLARARVRFAAHVVILAEPDGDDDCDRVDDLAILKYLELQTFLEVSSHIPHPKPHITVELQRPDSVKYLAEIANTSSSDDINGEMYNGHARAMFAAGMVYNPVTTDKLLCQNYYNPHLGHILRVLLGIDESLLETRQVTLAEAKQAETSQDPSLAAEFRGAGLRMQGAEARVSHGSRIRQVPLPGAFRHPDRRGTFRDLFRYLNSQRLLPIALLRSGQESGVGRMPYVVVNPEKEAIVYPTDRVFVL